MRLRPTNAKVVGRTHLMRLRASWKKRKKTVVFTNGVYDILHPGHVSLLEKAGNLGHVLIVGVNSDASARRLGKSGPKRPVNALKDRMRVLAALECVDAVSAFSEDTPETLLARLRPDVLVKGADYKVEDVAGRAFAKRTVLIPLKKGYSTTHILKRID